MVFINARHSIIAQSVFHRKVDKGFPVVTVHTSIMATEPIVVILGLENMPDRFVEFCNDLAFRNRCLLLVVARFRGRLYGQVPVLTGGASGQSDN